MRSFYKKIRTSNTAPSRCGVTLIEILIVLTIAIMITAATIPIMAPAMQNRRMREASRLVSTYITGARARAIEIGRPVGVMFERFNGQPYSMVLSYVEVPQPYAGDNVNSKMSVDSTGQVTFIGIPGATPTPDLLWNGLIRYGDLVRLDCKGPMYVLVYPGYQPGQAITTAPSAGNPWRLFMTNLGVPNLPANYTNGVSYQIFRQPSRSSSAPMQLPEGTVIDLASSGMSVTGTLNTGTPTSPIVAYNPWITFTPGGAVDYVGIPSLQRASGPVFFLIGRRDLMPDVSKSNTNENMYDTAAQQHLQNFWVSISPQTGRVTVAEQARTISTTDFAGGRTFVQTGQSVGGR